MTLTAAGTDCRDVIVIGAGPAGLAAARVASQHGLSVLLIDEQAGAGGQIWRNAARMASTPAPLSQSYRGAAGALAVLDAPGVDHVTGATVLDVALSRGPESPSRGSAAASPTPDVAQGLSGPVPHTTDPSDQPQVRVTWLSAVTGDRGIRETAARALIVATGAMERPVLFPGATLPGVMGVGAVQSILKQSGMVPKGRGLVLAGQGPLLLLTLSQILALGGTIDAVLDLAPRGGFFGAASGLLPALISDPKLVAQGAHLLWRARRSGVAWYSNVRALRATGTGTATDTGTDGIEQVCFDTNGTSVRLPCSRLAVHDGVIPNTQLTRLLNLEHDWSDGQQAFVPRCTIDGRTSAATVWVAGDGAGIAGVVVAGLRGALAGLDVARALGNLTGPDVARHADPLRHQIARRAPARGFVERLYAPLPVTALCDAEAAQDTIVCRCEAVTLARVHAAIRDGATGPNRVKTFTRCGMGACQGRICGNPLTRIIAAATGLPAADAGALRVRPPLKPTLISDYLGIVAAGKPPV